MELSLSLLTERNFDARKQLLKELSNSHSHLRQSISLKDANQPDELFSRWTNSSVYKHIDLLLAGSQDRDLPVPVITPPSNDNQFHQAGTANISYHAPSFDTPLQLHQDFWLLLDHYYTYTHNWLPISDKNDMLKTAYSYPIAESEIHESGDSGHHAELWAIIALTNQSRAGRTAASDAIVAVTRRLIPHDPGRIASGHVRALLLLSLLALANGDKMMAWTDVGAAVRILLYKNPIGLDEPRSQHLRLACFVVESFTSALLGLMPHLTKQALGSVNQVNEDGLEEWSPWQPLAVSEGQSRHRPSQSRQPGRCLSTFNALVDICGALASRSDSSLLRKLDEHLSNTAWQGTSQASTPQQIQLELLAAWARSRAGLISPSELGRLTAPCLQQLKYCGGTGAAPPILVSLLDDLVTKGGISLTDTGRSDVQEILQLWGRSAVRPRRSTVQSARVSNDRFPDGQPRRPQSMSMSYNYAQPDSMTFTTHREDRAPNSITVWANDVSQMDPQGIPDPTGDAIIMAANQDTPSGMSDGIGANSDFEALFEEMAQLDQTRQANDGSQFMQNLGLGPDSDLRAFFGADYQEPDPLLAYLQFDGLAPPGASTLPDFPT